MPVIDDDDDGREEGAAVEGQGALPGLEQGRKWHVHGQGISQMTANGAMVSMERGCLRFLVAVLLSGTAAAAEVEVSDGSSDGGGDLVTEFDSNETSSGGQQLPGFFPELIDGETLTGIGRLFVFAAVGAVLCTVLYVGTHAWRHDRFCFSHPHPGAPYTH